MPRNSIGTRQHVIFSQLQKDRLTKLAVKTGISVSEHLRRAVDLYFMKIVEDHQRNQK